MASVILMALSAGIVLTLGFIHLVYTFVGQKLHPRDPELKAAMQRAAMRITSETTMWRAWVGFNASHSMGAILFGLIFGYLALCQPALLFGSSYLLTVGFAMLAGLMVLAKRYWFRIPFVGVSISLACYVASVIAIWA